MNESDEKLLREMTAQSGEMWMQADNRIRAYAKPVIVCLNPERAYYLWRIENCTDGLSESMVSINGWRVDEQPLKMFDAAEFFAAFGSHWPYWLGAIIRDAPFRAFIKNGRREGWSISLDIKKPEQEIARSFENLAASLGTFQQRIEEASDQ